jgi:hypothetical protein
MLFGSPSNSAATAGMIAAKSVMMKFPEAKTDAAGIDRLSYALANAEWLATKQLGRLLPIAYPSRFLGKTDFRKC